MGSTLRQDVDFNALFKKLGHHLDEIRVRALENILSKLEHKLICDSDLVQERHLFIRLLEWFNYPKSSRHSDVLNLLCRLSEHTSGAETLQDIGAIEFLTSLRKDVTSALQPVVDQVLENCMRLPDVDIGLDHAPECIYQRHNHTGMTAGAETTVDTIATRHTQDYSLAPSTNAPSEHGARLPDYREPPLGFFEGCQGDLGQQPMTPGSGSHPTAADLGLEGSSCFRMTIFPWLSLTPTDRHVISSTNSSLQSREASMLVSTCEFLSDVVFQDFPAEIFLQRPNIVKNLLSLLSGPIKEGGVARLQAVRTLADYVTCLRSRIRCHQDPNFYTAKQDFSTTPTPFSTPSSSSSANQNGGGDGRPSVIGWTDSRPRGDGRDGDTSGSSTGTSRASSVGLSPEGRRGEPIDLEDVPALQYLQLTLPQFCTQVLERALPLLRSTDQVITMEVLHLLHLTLDIVIAMVTPGLWQDQSMAARECSEKLIESLDVMADLLKFHHHSNLKSDPDDTNNDPGDLVQQRQCLVGLHVLLARILDPLVPLDKCRGVISENLLSIMNTLVYDEALSNTLPDLQLQLLGYLQYLDDGRYSVYVATATICQSLQRTCKFMNLAQEEASRLSKETLSLCEGAFDSLPYHRHMNYITETVRLCSDIGSRSQHYEDHKARYKKLLLQLLAHPIGKLRLGVFTAVLQCVKTNLSVLKASEPGSTSCEKVRFIIDADILYEIIVFGLADKDTKVANAASELVTHLLKSQLLMSPALWQLMLKELARALPILQSYASVYTVLGTSILAMLETKPSTSPSEITQGEKLWGTLRCMLSTDLKVRSEALKRLFWYLSNEEGGVRRLPIFSELNVTDLANLLIVDTPRSLDNDLGRSVFQVDGLWKVYAIFTSLSVDPGMKKSAVDQLAIIYQDPSLHAAFKKDCWVEKILEHIQSQYNLPFRPGPLSTIRKVHLKCCRPLNLKLMGVTWNVAWHEGIYTCREPWPMLRIRIWNNGRPMFLPDASEAASEYRVLKNTITQDTTHR
ncbi:rotatin-like isoform X2 [Mya arenaria]|uniref:rotatin-like isoform X2 n=1 Tax=Mya arenaria TaxID=6604 RepID=UPI0022E44E43|nr:rotatin-like isoform X2 [Mya arenaria]